MPTVIDRRPAPIVAAVCVVLAALTLFIQAERLGWRYIDQGKQARMLRAILNERAGDPWQYRVLSAFMAKGLATTLVAFDVPHPIGTANTLLRFVQNVAIFALAASLCAALGASPQAVIAALCLLAWSMTQALYDSDLQPSTYMDVAFYLLGTQLVLTRRLRLFPLVVLLAALNRETSALLPVGLLATCVTDHWTPAQRKTAVVVGLVSLAVFAP